MTALTIVAVSWIVTVPLGYVVGRGISGRPVAMPRWVTAWAQPSFAAIRTPFEMTAARGHHR